MDSIIFNIIDTHSFEDGITGLTWLENNLSAYDPLDATIELDASSDDQDDEDDLIDDEDVFH